MLTSKEKYIMEYVYQKCFGKKSCLITPREVISYASDKYVMYPNELEKIMTNLSYDNYIELVKSDKKGEPVFCVALKMKGEGFHRELVNNKRTWAFNIGRTVLLAVISVAVTLLLKWIF
ncbi:MAG: hypothetical protein IJX26_00865 [Clostridia bacterium]|nr:hypothetical protein [Clostridia bacterium]